MVDPAFFPTVTQHTKTAALKGCKTSQVIWLLAEIEEAWASWLDFDTFHEGADQSAYLDEVLDVVGCVHKFDILWCDALVLPQWVTPSELARAYKPWAVKQARRGRTPISWWALIAAYIAMRDIAEEARALPRS